MVWIPDGIKSLRTCITVSTECRSVADGQTDRRTDGIALRGKNRDFYTRHLYSTPQLGSLHRIIVIRVGVEKVEWRGYRKVKKVLEYAYSF